MNPYYGYHYVKHMLSGVALRSIKFKGGRQVNICGDCKREWYVPDCGAGVRDYEVIKGVGVVSCKKYLPKANGTTEQPSKAIAEGEV